MSEPANMESLFIGTEEDGALILSAANMLSEARLWMIHDEKSREIVKRIDGLLFRLNKRLKLGVRP